MFAQLFKTDDGQILFYRMDSEPLKIKSLFYDDAYQQVSADLDFDSSGKAVEFWYGLDEDAAIDFRQRTLEDM